MRLTTPPSQSRDGTAIAMAIQSRRPTALTYSSSAWTCPNSTCPRRTRCSWKSLAVPAGPVAPVGDGPLVEPEGGDDRLDRTAVAEQGDHDGHQVDGLLEAVERGVAGGGEGAAAGRAAVAPFLAAMDADVAEAELAPCGAVGVVAELGSAGPSVSLRGTVWRPCLEECSVDPRFSSPYPRITVQWGATEKGVMTERKEPGRGRP